MARLFRRTFRAYTNTDIHDLLLYSKLASLGIYYRHLLIDYTPV